MSIADNNEDPMLANKPRNDLCFARFCSNECVREGGQRARKSSGKQLISDVRILTFQYWLNKHRRLTPPQPAAHRRKHLFDLPPDRACLKGESDAVNVTLRPILLGFHLLFQPAPTGSR